MSNNLNHYRQHHVQALAAARGRTEQPQPQPQPGVRPTTSQNSRSTVHQLYTVQPHAQVQSQPQSQSQLYQAPGPSTIYNAQPNADLNNILRQFLVSFHHLSDQQRYLNESFANSDKHLETLASSVSSIREIADGLTRKLEAHDSILEKLEQNGLGGRAGAKEIDVMKILVGEMRAFKKTLGKSCDRDDGRTVLGRLDAVTFAVGELLERARDPEANLANPGDFTTGPSIIDLTMSLSPSPPPVRCTSPIYSRIYADVGTSPAPSPPPPKRKSFASIQVGTSPLPSSDSSQSPTEPTPYPGRFSSARSSVDNTTSSPEMSFTALNRQRSELASPSHMDIDAIDPTEPTLGSQIRASPTFSTNNSQDATRMQTKPRLSDNTQATMTKSPHLENIRTTIHPHVHSDLAPAQKPLKNTSSLDGPAYKNDRAADRQNVELLNATSGSTAGVPTFGRPHAFTVSTSTSSPVSTQMEVQRPADKTIATLMASVARLKNSHLSVIGPSVRDLGSSHMGADEGDHDEEKMREIKKTLYKAEKRDKEEEIKKIEKQSFEINGSCNGDGPVPAPGLMDLSRHLRGRRQSSSRFPISPSPSTPLSSLSSRAGSRLSTDPLEGASVPSRLSPYTKLYSPTKTKILAGAGVGRPHRPVGHAVPTLPPAPASPTPAASATISLAVPAVPSPTLTAVTTNPVISSPKIISPVTTTTIPSKTSTPAASSRLDSLVSTSAIFSKLFSPSQVSSSGTAGEASVDKMVIEKEGPNDEGESRVLVEEAIEKIELRMANRNFEEGGEDPFHSSSPSLYLSPQLTPSVSGSPHLHPAVLPTQLSPRPRPRSGLSPNTISLSPLSSMTCTPPSQSQSQTRNVSLAPLLPPKSSACSTHVRMPSGKQPDSSPPSPLVVVVSSSHSPPGTHRETDRGQDGTIEKLMKEVDQDEEMNGLDHSLEQEQEHPNPLDPQSPLFSSPNTSLERCETKEQFEEAGLKLKSPGKRDILSNSSDDEDGSGGGTADIAVTIITLSKTAVPAPTQMQTETQTLPKPVSLIEVISPRDPSPIFDAEKEKGKAKEIDKTQVSDSFLGERYNSLGDNADIVRSKKRRVSVGSSITQGGPSSEVSGLASTRKDNAKEEKVDDSEVLKMKSGKNNADVGIKKVSLLNLKPGKKGESAALTRVKKRKARAEFVIGEQAAEGDGEHDDGLDQERPLKRARERISERQLKTEHLEKGKRLARESSGSSFGAGMSTRVMKPRSAAASGSGSAVGSRVTKPRSSASASTKSSKGRLSAKGQKVEVEWPKMTKGEDLVECNKCLAWYHYGCVGVTAGDTRLRNGKKYFCPPCEAGVTIKKLTISECWRPGCVVPTGYVVEKIIGRYKKFVDGQGFEFKYLLRWKGYILSESTWEPEESMYDPPFMIDKFRMDALEEGINIDEDESGLILLRVAKDPCVPKAT